MRESRLGKSDGVHIALDDNHLLGAPGRVARLGEAVEHFPLPEDRGFGCVEVFRLRIAERAATESYRASPPVGDGEHDPVAERGARLSLMLALAEQPGLDEGLCLETAALQRLHERR